MKLWLWLGFCFLGFSAFGQRTGQLRGTVKDKNTQEVIIGATVAASGTTMGALTNVEGEFELTLPSGVYDMEVRYFGFETHYIPQVEVREDDSRNLEIHLLQKPSHGLEEVVITAALKRESISALYLQQRKEISVSSGISSEQIKKTGDRNTAEVLKRVSGASIVDNQYVVIRGLSDRYNLAMVNESLMANTEPDRKSFSFELIPSNLIDQILVSKTATADMPGDFAGGLVRVFTRDIPIADFHSIGMSLSQNTQTWGREAHYSPRPAGAILGFPGNGRSLPSEFGTEYMDYRSAPMEDQWSAARNLENPYMPNQSLARPTMGIQHSLGTVRRWKNGGELGWVGGWNYRNATGVIPRYTRARFEKDRVGSYFEDYTTKMQSQASAMANLTYVNADHRFSWKNLYYKNFQETFYERNGYTTSNSQEIVSYSAVPWERQVFQSQMEGSHVLPWKGIKWAWNLHYMNLRSRQDDLRTVFYSRNLDFDEQDRPQPQTDLPFQIVDRNSRRFFSAQNDHSYGAQSYLQGPFNIDTENHQWKLGYAIQHRRRSFGARIFQYGLSGSAFSDGLTQYPIAEVFSPENLGPNGFRLEEITNPTDEYQASAFLQSAFLMVDTRFSDQWTLNSGLRWEAYEQTLISQDLTNQPIHQTDLFVDFLPSINLSFESSEQSKWRLAGSRTVNRPELREIAPFTFLDLENLWTLNGNPDLKRSQILNLDLRYEYYFSPSEIWTAGLFYKWFKDPIEKVMDDQSNLDLFIFGYQNAPKAETYGLELDFRKNLDFIAPSPWLGNLYLAGNFTYVISRVGLEDLTGEKGYRSLEGQSPYLVNFSASYEDKDRGWGANLLYHRMGHRIAIVGNHTIPTTWEQGRDMMDFQLTAFLWEKKADLKLTISDLFNQPHTLYWNGNHRNSLQRGGEMLEEGKDRIIQEYKLGTGLSLGFTYHF